MKTDNNLTAIDASKAWIQTASGGVFHILDPRPEEINIEDIAHASAMLCRFTGHGRRFYSVAEHAVHVSRLDIENPFWGLMHDASEAYIADLNRPLKHFTQAGPAYQQVEKIVMNAICRKFRLPEQQPESVHRADKIMLYIEKDQLMWPMEWDTAWGDPLQRPDIRLPCWSPEIARVEFLHRFYELTKQI